MNRTKPNEDLRKASNFFYVYALTDSMEEGDSTVDLLGGYRFLLRYYFGEGEGQSAVFR